MSIMIDVEIHYGKVLIEEEFTYKANVIPRTGEVIDHNELSYIVKRVFHNTANDRIHIIGDLFEGDKYRV